MQDLLQRNEKQGCNERYNDALDIIMGIFSLLISCAPNGKSVLTLRLPNDWLLFIGAFFRPDFYEATSNIRSYPDAIGRIRRSCYHFHVEIRWRHVSDGQRSFSLLQCTVIEARSYCYTRLLCNTTWIPCVLISVKSVTVFRSALPSYLSGSVLRSHIYPLSGFMRLVQLSSRYERLSCDFSELDFDPSWWQKLLQVTGSFC